MFGSLGSDVLGALLVREIAGSLGWLRGVLGFEALEPSPWVLATEDDDEDRRRASCAIVCSKSCKESSTTSSLVSKPSIVSRDTRDV